MGFRADSSEMLLDLSRGVLHILTGAALKRLIKLRSAFIGASNSTLKQKVNPIALEGWVPGSEAENVNHVLLSDSLLHLQIPM